MAKLAGSTRKCLAALVAKLGNIVAAGNIVSCYVSGVAKLVGSTRNEFAALVGKLIKMFPPCLK